MEKLASFPRRTATAVLIGLLLAALLLLVGYAAGFFFLVFGGITIAVVISAMSHWVADRTWLNYGLAMGIVLVALVLLAAGGIWALAPAFSEQADQLAKSLPSSFNQLRSRLQGSSWGRELLEGIPHEPEKLLSGSGGKGVLPQVTGFLSTTLGGLINVLIVLITGIYLAASPALYRRGFVSLFTPSYRDRLLDVLEQCYQTLINWFISRSISMLVVATATAAGLALLGVPFAVVLGILAGLLNFIPNLGPYLAVAPAMLVAFPDGIDQALYVFALYMGIQSLEGYILTPLLDKRFVSVPPALLLFAQVLLGILVGLPGILFASPLVAVLLVIVQELYIKDHLEKPSGEAA